MSVATGLAWGDPSASGGGNWMIYSVRFSSASVFGLSLSALTSHRRSVLHDHFTDGVSRPTYRLEHRRTERTFGPLAKNFTATLWPVAFSFIRHAVPKLPFPNSLI